MKVFEYSGLIEVPSSWTLERAQAYIYEHLLSSQAERDSLCISEADIPEDDL